MQNEPGGFGFSARYVPPRLAGLKPGEKDELHSLPGFRHAESENLDREIRSLRAPPELGSPQRRMRSTDWSPG
jgi:hypothetical protein